MMDGINSRQDKTAHTGSHIVLIIQLLRHERHADRMQFIAVFL